MRKKNFIVWLILGALLLLVLNLPEGATWRIKAYFREGLAPIQGVVWAGAVKAREAVQSVRGLGGALSENRKMATELVRLRNEVQQLKSLEVENIALREYLHFSQTATRAHIPCEVIARDVSGWWQTLRLGKGTRAGIKPHMAVVTSEGLVGKTVSVSPHTSDVLLLADPSCKVSAQISRTGLFGILSGQGEARRGQVVCRMDFINKDAPVRSGDEVVTSGLGGVYPKGLLIGYVDRVEPDASGLYQKAFVVPRADLGSLSYVFVVTERTATKSGGTT